MLGMILQICIQIETDSLYITWYISVYVLFLNKMLTNVISFNHGSVQMK
jgi:hypothetical protein